MRIPRKARRTWIGVATVATAAAILLAVAYQGTADAGGGSDGTTTDPPQVTENAPGGTAVGTPLNASATGGIVSYALSGTGRRQLLHQSRQPARSASPRA